MCPDIADREVMIKSENKTEMYPNNDEMVHNKHDSF